MLGASNGVVRRTGGALGQNLRHWVAVPTEMLRRVPDYPRIQMKQRRPKEALSHIGRASEVMPAQTTRALSLPHPIAQKITTRCARAPMVRRWITVIGVAIQVPRQPHELASTRKRRGAVRDRFGRQDANGSS